MQLTICVYSFFFFVCSSITHTFVCQPYPSDERLRTNCPSVNNSVCVHQPSVNLLYVVCLCACVLPLSLGDLPGLCSVLHWLMCQF